MRRFEAIDTKVVLDLIHETIDASYASAYPPRAVSHFKDFHSAERILDRAAAGEVLVAVREGGIVGTGAIQDDEIRGVFVRPRHQGRGVGSAVMDWLETIAGVCGSEVVHLDVSLPSRRFYERRGYVLVEERSIDVGEGQRLDYWRAEKTLGCGQR